MGHTRLRRVLALLGDVKNKRILDIGCASGYLGAELKRRGAYVVGVDISAGAIEVAQRKLDEAYRIDDDGKFLEHIFDPRKTLHIAKSYLKSDGSIIITTPNFLTWTNRVRFLFGLFEYADQGMFDFGHIRWFTYRYLQSVLNHEGLVITEERNIIFPGKLTFLLKHFPSLFAWQFIVRVQAV